ncbi:MAG TPA: hypothetical protein VLJ11_02895 [Bryobacteraceae bacterium]|nr:hypothetical protein [Bryobacteraceae bacterium]
MPETILCKICGRRRARRACPAVDGEICPICCGENREVTLSCPLDCPYLREAHAREKPIPIDERQMGNPDIVVLEEFIHKHHEMLMFLVFSLYQAAIRTPGAVDSDVLAALDAAIQTHRTLESGLVYEHTAENAVAAAIQRMFSASLADYQKVREEREALAPLRNSDILSALVFIQRVGLKNLNGKPKGRMYIDLLRQTAPPDMRVEERAPSIIL